MASVFGGGQYDAKMEAAEQRAQARRDRQEATEETAREQQRAERGTARASRGRNMLVGDLSRALSSTLGGGGQG